MPILRKSEPLPERPVVILIYGDPGIGKTSLFNTSNNPLLVDFDRGKDRAIYRQDTLVVNSWEDVLTEEKANTFKSFGTVGIDTAKSALDDFLMSYVCKLDYKNAKNKLAAYGAIGDHFKMFVANRRSESADIIIIAHSKDEKEGDTVKKIPDVTGGSYQLLLRIADQVGYMTMRNNHRTIQWEPTDTTIGKNVAKLPVTEIPLGDTEEFKTFMANIITTVKTSLTQQSESQAEALEKSAKIQKEIGDVKNAEDMNMILTAIMDFPKHLKDPLIKLMSVKQKELALIFDKKTASFVDPAPKEESKVPEELPFG